MERNEKGQFCKATSENKEAGKIRIETVKFVPANGIASRKVTKIEGVLPSEALPQEYLNQDYHIYLAKTKDYIFCVHGSNLDLGHEYKEPEFQNILAYIQKSGDTLHEINEKIRKLRLEWKGTETFVI